MIVILFEFLLRLFYIETVLLTLLERERLSRNIQTIFFNELYTFYRLRFLFVMSDNF